MGILCSDKVYVYAKNNGSTEQFLRVIWKAVFWAIVLSLTEINLFSIPQKNSIIS